MRSTLHIPRTRYFSRLRRKKYYIAMSLQSGNALGSFRDRTEALNWLEMLREEEPEALKHVRVIETDYKGMPIRGFTIDREGGRLMYS